MSLVVDSDECDEEEWDLDEALADARYALGELCDSLSVSIDTCDELIENKYLELAPEVARWMATVSEVVAPVGRETAVQLVLALDDSGPIDLSELFPTLWEIEETDEFDRDAEIDDQQQWLAGERVRIASESLCRAIDDLFALACERPADPSEVAALAPRVDHAMEVIEQWHEAWMTCIHGYEAVFGRYPGDAGEFTSRAQGWLRDMGIDAELRRILDKGSDGEGSDDKDSDGEGSDDKGSDDKGSDDKDSDDKDSDGDSDDKGK